MDSFSKCVFVRAGKHTSVHDMHPHSNGVWTTYNHMTYKLYLRDLKCIYCMKNNDNDLVSSCFEYVSNNENSILGNKIAYFR